jgi:hypothetical protein
VNAGLANGLPNSEFFSTRHEDEIELVICSSSMRSRTHIMMNQSKTYEAISFFDAIIFLVAEFLDGLRRIVIRLEHGLKCDVESRNLMGWK